MTYVKKKRIAKVEPDEWALLLSAERSANMIWILSAELNNPMQLLAMVGMATTSTVSFFATLQVCTAGWNVAGVATMLLILAMLTALYGYGVAGIAARWEAVWFRLDLLGNLAVVLAWACYGADTGVAVAFITVVIKLLVAFRAGRIVRSVLDVQRQRLVKLVRFMPIDLLGHEYSWTFIDERQLESAFRKCAIKTALWCARFTIYILIAVYVWATIGQESVAIGAAVFLLFCILVELVIRGSYYLCTRFLELNTWGREW